SSDLRFSQRFVNKSFSLKKLPFFHLAGALNFFAFLLHSGHGTKCFVPLINISSLLHVSHLATLIFAVSFSLFFSFITLYVFLFFPTYICYSIMFFFFYNLIFIIPCCTLSNFNLRWLFFLVLQFDYIRCFSVSTYINVVP